MKSDLELFLAYDTELAGLYNKGYYTLDLVKNALSNNILDMLDLSICDEAVKEIFTYLHLKKKYSALKKEANGQLTVSKDGFKLSGKDFLTIDELEKAWKNKAFL